jgi:hypothetical protein
MLCKVIRMRGVKASASAWRLSLMEGLSKETKRGLWGLPMFHVH